MALAEHSVDEHDGVGRRLLPLLLAISLIRGCLYAAIVPPWQAPDENGHFEHVWLIAHLGRLPTPSDISLTFERELLSSLYEWRYGDFIGRPLPSQMPARLGDLPGNIFALGSRSALNRFSLAYIWAALFVWPLEHQDLLLQLYAARLSSVVLNVGIVWLAWHIFQQLLPRRPRLVAAMTAFVVFLPQHTFINASVGDGPLAELFACLVLYGWLRLFQYGRVRDVITIVSGTILGLWTKKTDAFLIPLDVAMTAVFLRHVGLRRLWRQRTLQWVPFISIIGGTLILLGWGVWRTPVGYWIRYTLQGWWSAPEIYWQNGPIAPYDAIRYTFESFWALFGWMSVRAGDSWYVLFYVLVALSVEGWALPRSRPWSVPAWAMWLLAGAFLLAGIGFIAFMTITPYGLYYYQGRYLFPVMVPAAFFIVGGWARWVPARWQHHFPQVTIILLAALDSAVTIPTFLSHFYRLG